ncbi:nephrocystin-3-like [Tubulanus polymorphus]|uniref:nephrocystin-3-like n=1 Tax=Tubulanus polymorphus TaxID=672921 RepID=UPI003DA56C5E
MGTTGSLVHPNDEDDVLGDGVIKRIPIEVKPRGKLGLRSVGSFGSKKQKGGSLRSALSLDLESPEVEKIKREFEMYRLQKESEMANLEKQEHKFHMENKRMRSELQALQKTCAKLRAEKDAALDAEQQALIRAASFENEKNKIQRQFKIFRETKESEIQNFLRARRDLEGKILQKNNGLMIVEDLETSSKIGGADDSTVGSMNAGDWWPTLSSDQSLGSSSQLHFPAFRGPEFACSQLEIDGPFVNVTREDWLSASANLSSQTDGLPSADAPATSTRKTIRVYIACPVAAKRYFKIVCDSYVDSLGRVCSEEGRELLVVYLPDDHESSARDVSDFDSLLRQNSASKTRQIQQSNIFVGILGSDVDRFTEMEYRVGHLDSPGSKQVLFWFIADDTGSGGLQESDSLKDQVRDSGNCKIVEGDDVESFAKELENLIKIELSCVDSNRNNEFGTQYNDAEMPEQLCGGKVWDVNCDREQLEFFQRALISSCELEFERYYETLNGHLSSPGPLPPLLIRGAPGSGRTLLLAKWIQFQRYKPSCGIVLYHFVADTCSTSADAVAMIRRLTVQLTRRITAPPPTLSTDPDRIVDEFPRWLEKISSRTRGGVLLVLDCADRCDQPEKHLKWLLDPLPVDTRVIVAADDSCPQSWRSWPTLRLQPLGTRSIKELLRIELSSFGLSLNADQESYVLTHCRTSATCNPLYVTVLISDICRCNNYDLDRRLKLLLSTTDCVSLYKTVIATIAQQFEIDTETPPAGGVPVAADVLRFVYVARNGLSENELLRLLPCVTWNFLAPLVDALTDRHVLAYRSGLLVLAHGQARQAIRELYLGGSDAKLIDSVRRSLIDYYRGFLRPGAVTCRVVDELPWHIKQLDSKDELRQCLLVLCIFQRLYCRGRCGELLDYWKFIGVDKTLMAREYFGCIKHLEGRLDEFDGAVTLPRVADLCEVLGRFLCDVGLLSQAAAPLQHALELRESALDPDDPKVAQSLHQLAGLHAQWGKYVTAEQLYKQALEIYENATGPDSYNVAKQLDSLSVLYQRQDKHELVEPLRRRAATIRKKLNQSRAAAVAAKTSRAPSSSLQQRALQLEELTLVGEESIDVARTLNELGVLYYLQNDAKTAETFFKRSFEMRRKLLGDKHADVAQSANNLAALYNDQKQYDQAAPLYELALEIRRKNSPVSHQSIASIVKHLSMLYKKQGKLSRAEPLYREAIEIREKVFGPNHPSVATAMVNLAVVCCQLEQQTEALPLYERALRVYEDSLGATHPRVAETLRNLAVLHYERTDYETAAKFYKRATEIKPPQRHEDDVPPQTAPSLDNVSGLRGPRPRSSSSDETKSTVKLELEESTDL